MVNISAHFCSMYAGVAFSFKVPHVCFSFPRMTSRRDMWTSVNDSDRFGSGLRLGFGYYWWGLGWVRIRTGEH